MAESLTLCGGTLRFLCGTTAHAVVVCLLVLLLAPSTGEAFGVGCGIYVQEESEVAAQLFFAKHDDDVALMRVDGNLLTLAVVSEKSRGQLRDLGDVLRRVYVKESLRVEATFTVTRVCALNARECDGVGISASFLVHAGDATQTLNGKGTSGC